MSVWSIQAVAQERRAAISVGDSKLYPELRLDVDGNDNAFRRSNNEVDDSAFIVRPSLEWVADRRETSISATFDGEFRSADVSETNYTNADFRIGIDSRLNSRSRAEASFGFDFGHLPLGTRFTRFDPFNNDQTTFQDVSLRGEYTYGARLARLNASVGLLVRSFEYTNNEELTAGSDFNAVTPFIELSSRLSGETRGFWRVAVGQTDFEFDNRTSLETNLGVTWNATGRSGGRVSVGADSQMWDNREDVTSAVLRATGWWLPRSFSRFEVTVVRDFLDTELIGDNEQPVADTVDFSWRHEWSSRVSHALNASYEVIDRACPSDDTERLDATFEIALDVRRWVTIGAGAGFGSQDTSFCAGVPTLDDSDFDRSSFFSFIQFSL